jgi:hypothetical protein
MDRVVSTSSQSWSTIAYWPSIGGGTPTSSPGPHPSKAPCGFTYSHLQVELYRAQFDVDVVREIDVPVITPTEILDQHRTPDFLSLDTEGMDALILESIDFARHPIKVICVETTEMSRTS